MSTFRLVAKNMGFLLTSRIATKVISFFTLLYIARYLGPGDFGKFSFVFSFIYFFGFIPDFGIHNILVREAAKEPENAGKLIGNATILQTFLSLIAFLLALFAINIIDYPVSTKNALYIASFGLLITSISAFSIIYEVNLRMEYTVLFSVTSRLIFFVLAVIATLKNLTLNAFVLASVVADFVHNFLTVLFSKKLIKPNFNLQVNLMKMILREALPMAVASVFTMIYFRIDVVMLSFLKDDTAVGLYSAAYRLTEAFIFISSAFMTSIFPLMSKYYKNSFELFTFIYAKSFKYLFALGLVLAMAVTFFSKEIVFNIYGSEYQGSVIVLKILIWATAIMFVNNLISITYISSGNQKIIAKVTAFAAILNSLLNLILIPSLSYAGAAATTLFTELFVMLFGIYWIKRNLLHEVMYRETIFLFVGMLISSASFVLLRLYINEIFSCLLSLIVFISILYISGWVDADDRRILMKTIRLNSKI
ncbi:flippase [Methanosarcina mazei]|uniref:Uncharacterized protein n=1 Tax=Methanosarcina mazei LYC TaxID=1434114 RepID=A0A0E3WP90_METMZ|nr:flippase [Methanosarcina mazei]AKB69078.1 hypothetical protein MSMAL_2535 [Methanosarcina mazei LYC]